MGENRAAQSASISIFMSNFSAVPEAPADPVEAVRTELQAELAADENVLAALAVDLDQQLRFLPGLLALSERRLLARTSGGDWRSWPLAPGLQLRHADHAGVGSLELCDARQRLARWRFTLGVDPQALQFVAAFDYMARLGAYLPKGASSQTYGDSQNQFALGRAAIYPAGSWDISVFNTQAEFKMGAFYPPVKKEGDTCYISDHADIAMGANAKSKHPEETKKFLAWLTSADFADIYANSLPGFFSLSSHEVKLQDPLAQEFVNWRGTCKTTIRSTYQVLSRGTPNLENETWGASANVINGSETPEAAAKRLQDGLDSWYKPAP